MSWHNGAKIVTNGLVLYLDAANPKSYPGSGNNWYDLTPNNNSGVLTNGPLYNSDMNGVIVFDGVNDKVQTTYAPQFGDFTVCIWFKDTGSSSWGRLVDKSYTDGFYISSFFASTGANYDGAVS